MFSSLREGLIVLASVVAAITAISAFASTKLGRPIRWLFRRNIGEPIGGWVTREMDDRVKEHTDPIFQQLMYRNGGMTMRDAMTRIETKQDESNADRLKLHAIVNELSATLTGHLAEVASTRDEIVARLTQTQALLDDLSSVAFTYR